MPQVKTMLATFAAISRTGSSDFSGLADGVVMDWAPGIFRVLLALCQLYVPWMGNQTTWENHRKTIGKWWFFMGFYGINLDMFMKLTLIMNQWDSTLR